MKTAALIFAALALVACGGPQGASTASDAGTNDAGTQDAGSSDAGSGSHDGGVVDPRTWQPPGKGLWIWYFAYTGLTAAQAAQKAVDIGASYVLIKSGQDASYWSTRYNAANLAEFTSRGLQVFAWPYITPANIAGSIDAVAQAAQVPGTAGVVLDVEVEFEGNYTAQATQLCQGIRAKVPGVWLGYTTFGWVGYHPTFPFKQFDADCGDAFFPQIYWSDRGVTWSYGYTQAMQMISAAGLKAPVWIIQSNDDTPSSTSPSTADLNSFFDQAGHFSSLWELPAAGESSKSTQLSLLHWSNR
jgi:hypothetical protein